MKNWLKAWWWLIAGAVVLSGSCVIQAIIPAIVPPANKQGNSAKFFLATGAFTATHYLTTDANGNAIDGGALAAVATSGSASDLGTGTLPIARIAAAAITPGKMSASTFDAQVDAATVTWAIASVLNAQATLLFTTHGGSRTLNITGPVIGGNYVLVLTQDATGGETLVLGTGCTWKVVNAGAGAIVLTNAANAIDILTFTYDGANCYAALQTNFS